MEQVTLKDIEDYINWYKSEFGSRPDIHIDEICDIIEKGKNKVITKTESL